MGCILNKTAYEWPIVVTSFDVDMHDRLKISSLMKYQQEIGERHLNAFGTTTVAMREEQNLSFIFTKMNILVHRLPSSGEEITIRTWCSELRGARFTRNYVLLDKDSKPFTEAKAEVTVLDLSTRRIVRPTAINSFNDFLYNDDLENNAEYPQKLNFEMQNPITFVRPVRFSDIDYNGHVNNTVYADMAFDCLSFDALKRNVKGFEINFLNEILPTDTVNLSVAEDDTTFLISGNTDDKQNFAVRLKF